MIEHKTGCDKYGERYCWLICQGRCSAEFWEEEDRELIWCSYPSGHATIDEFDVVADHGNEKKGVYFSNPSHMDKRQKFGVGYSINLNGNLQHLISPVVGAMELAIHDEERLNQKELVYLWERLSFALQLIREDA